MERDDVVAAKTYVPEKNTRNQEKDKAKMYYLDYMWIDLKISRQSRYQASKGRVS